VRYLCYNFLKHISLTYIFFGGNAIVYLMMTSLLIKGFVGCGWWKREKEVMSAEQGKQ